MPTSFITEEMLQWLDQFTFGQVSELTTHWMRTYATRHTLNQDEINSYKNAQKALKPMFKNAEILRLRIVIAQQQESIDKLNAALNGYLDETEEKKEWA